MNHFSSPRQPASNGQQRERRRAPRRRRCVRVLFMATDSALDEPFGGVLLDSSQDGLRLAIHLDDIAEGTTLLVRPPAAPAGTPWVPVLVKNCRKNQEKCEVGCQFVSSLSPKTLLLFAS